MGRAFSHNFFYLRMAVPAAAIRHGYFRSECQLRRSLNYGKSLFRLQQQSLLLKRGLSHQLDDEAGLPAYGNRPRKIGLIPAYLAARTFTALIHVALDLGKLVPCLQSVCQS